MDAIKATEFKNKPGAYAIAEKRTLDQVIHREYNRKKSWFCYITHENVATFFILLQRL